MLFVVDASGSMGSRARMGAVKGAVLSLLLDAYQRRDKVGLVTFRGAGRRAGAAADLVGRGGRGPADRACRRAAGRRWPPGCCGRTRCCGWSGVRDPQRRPLLVVVTDGRATGGTRRRRTSPTRTPRRRLLAAAGTASVVVDCESGPVRLGLAGALGARPRRRGR